MSALAKLLNPKDNPSPVVLQNPLMGMLSTIIPREQVERLGNDVMATVTYVKDTLDLHTRQNQAIMAHLGITLDDRTNESDSRDANGELDV